VVCAVVGEGIGVAIVVVVVWIVDEVGVGVVVVVDTVLPGCAGHAEIVLVATELMVPQRSKFK